MSPPFQKPCTIADIAKLAKVSKKTVSRVVNNEPGVGVGKRAEIQKIIQDLDFQPNLSARILAGKRSQMIGLFIENSGSYVTEFQNGLAARCRDAGYHFVVEPWQPSDTLFAHTMKPFLQQFSLEGVVLLPPLCDNPLILELLRSEQVPVVRIAPSVGAMDSPIVTMDDYSAGRAIAAHLLEFGHRRIGFILGSPGHSASDGRYRAFLDEMASRNVPIDPTLVMPGDFRFEQGVVAAEQLLTRPNRPTAIIASNDDVAVAVVAVAGRLGLHIPTDLSVTGFDDTVVARMTWPQITTIHQPVAAMAKAAADLIIDHHPLRNGWPTPLPDQTLPYTVKIRNSTGPAPTIR